MHHQVVVVGRGLIGSAAARHLADAGHDVALIGPVEPLGYEAQGPFASHFDQGRVTRISASSEPWGSWAKASIDRYGEIAERSGIDFYDPVGLVVLGSGAGAMAAAGAALGADVELLSADQLFARSGIAAVVDGHEILWEGPPAGLINPRQLVVAQVSCATQSGATVLDDTVEQVGLGQRPIELQLRSGAVVTADRVLFCTGAYGASVAGIELAMQRRLRTIVLAELEAGPPLPTLIIDDPPHPALDEAYWVPPVLWPNGKYLIKIGGDSLPMQVGDDHDAIDDWFRSGASVVEADALFELLTALLPERSITRHSHRPCVVAYPVEGVPHIASVADGVAVAFGGCGAAAKSSDEIGRLGAEQVLSS